MYIYNNDGTSKSNTNSKELRVLLEELLPVALAGRSRPCRKDVAHEYVTDCKDIQ